MPFHTASRHERALYLSKLATDLYRMDLGHADTRAQLDILYSALYQYTTGARPVILTPPDSQHQWAQYIVKLHDDLNRMEMNEESLHQYHVLQAELHYFAAPKS